MTETAGPLPPPLKLDRLLDDVAQQATQRNAKEGRMKIQQAGKVLFMAAGLAAALVGCGGSDTTGGTHNIYFMGSVFNGATGELVTDYTLTLVYGSHSVKASVDKTSGRYTVGPLPAWNDYGIVVDSAGFRAFSSYNAGIAPPPPPSVPNATTIQTSGDVYHSNTTQTKDFDAYLFPTDLPVPAATITIIEGGSNPMPPSGQIRLQPTNQSLIQGQSADVGGQIWLNDNDILSAVINGSFSNGAYMIADNTLVYGVTYQITVYGVAGFQPNTNVTLQAGLQTGTSVTVSPAAAAPLQIISSDIATCTPPAFAATTPGGQISLKFNEPVEFTSLAYKESVDNSSSVSLPLVSCTLNTNLSTTVQERGTTVDVSGDTITFAFNPSVGFSTSVTAGCTPPASITSITYGYGTPTTLQVQPVGDPTHAAALSTLVFSYLSTHGSTSSSLICPLTQ
jgi:hypothetical protein